MPNNDYADVVRGAMSDEQLFPPGMPDDVSGPVDLSPYIQPGPYRTPYTPPQLPKPNYSDVVQQVYQQRGGGSSFDGDEVMPPIPLDPIAKANITDYFNLQRAKNPQSSASAQAATPPQVVPPTQRRSTNVSTPSQKLYDELPDRGHMGSPKGVYVDLQDPYNPHSREYLQDTVNNMYEGIQGHMIGIGQHPLLNNPAAAKSPIAQQAGMDALRKMMSNKMNANLPYLADQMGLHEDYDQALNLALRQLNTDSR